MDLMNLANGAFCTSSTASFPNDIINSPGFLNVPRRLASSSAFTASNSASAASASLNLIYGETLFSSGFFGVIPKADKSKFVFLGFCNAVKFVVILRS